MATESFNSEKGINAVEKISEFNRFGSVLGLERISTLLDRLGNPEKGLKYIHVAGTNGKGSVCRFIYHALRANGYSVGIYTSPFLTVFNERIEVDGEYIPDSDLATLTDEVLMKVNEMVAEGFDSPTEFEVITAIAFLYFARKNCDFVVLEVGLGGRGDSTNVIEKPLVSVITSISYDHMDRLGNTLAEIAADKAGIIKKGVPVVSNVGDLESSEVISEIAKEKGGALHDVSKFEYTIKENSIDGIVFSASVCGTPYDDVRITMLGEHQVQNAVTAITALEVMIQSGELRVEKSKLYAGIAEAKNMGRFEIMQRPCTEGDKNVKPYIVLDGAHNEAGAAALAETFKTYFPGKKALMVTGMLADKDTKKILDSFCTMADRFIATEPESDRKLSAEALFDFIKARGKECTAIADCTAAAAYAINESEGGKYKDCDVIVFAGSLYLIGKVRGILNGQF